MQLQLVATTNLPIIEYTDIVENLVAKHCYPLVHDTPFVIEFGDSVPPLDLDVMFPQVFNVFNENIGQALWKEGRTTRPTKILCWETTPFWFYHLPFFLLMRTAVSLARSPISFKKNPSSRLALPSPRLLLDYQSGQMIHNCVYILFVAF